MQKDLFSTLFGEDTSSVMHFKKSRVCGEYEQLEILIDNLKKSNVLLNTLLQKIEHLNKKL